MKNNLILKGKTKIENMEFNHIEGGFGEGKKAMLVKDIAEIHQREVKEINRNINNNINRFKNSIDIIDLKTSGFDSPVLSKVFTPAEIGNSKNIYLLSERGYSKLLKILEDDFAWEQYEKLVDGYFNMRQAIKENALDDLGNLSPQLQLLINMELKQKELEMAVTETKKEVQVIRDIITINPKAEWRKETNSILNAIGKKLDNYSSPRNEVYEALQHRANCRPNVLVNNLKKRALENGMTPSKVDKLNILDVLENDTRLREIYITIVKEMAINHDVA